MDYTAAADPSHHPWLGTHWVVVFLLFPLRKNADLNSFATAAVVL
jgi:hypothetical protein